MQFQIKEKDDSDGFLKLSGAKKWELGMDGAPTNMKLAQNVCKFHMSKLEFEMLHAVLYLCTLSINRAVQLFKMIGGGLVSWNTKLYVFFTQI